MQLELQSSADLITQMRCLEVWEKWTWFGCNYMSKIALLVWSLGLRRKITLPLCYVTCTGYKLVQGLTFKLCLYMYKALKKAALIYTLLVLDATRCRTLILLSKAIKGPRLRNSLPMDLRQAPSVMTIKKRLKTYTYQKTLLQRLKTQALWLVTKSKRRYRNKLNNNKYYYFQLNAWKPGISIGFRGLVASLLVLSVFMCDPNWGYSGHLHFINFNNSFFFSVKCLET